MDVHAFHLLQKKTLAELLQRHKDPRGRAITPLEQLLMEKTLAHHIDPICPHEGCELVNASCRHVARCPYRSIELREADLAKRHKRQTKQTNEALKTPNDVITETFCHVYLAYPDSLLRMKFQDIFPPGLQAEKWR
eukprot:Tbor_TRINITY_DN5543_c0_g1::TRINITY_DN5543_c0_g1_i2::g.12636::m.12636